MTKRTPPEEQQIRPFAAFLRDQGNGRTHDELSDALHDLLARVNETGKKGSITLTVIVEPLKGAADGMVVVKDQIKTKFPEFDRPAGVFFTDRAGNLSRNDPNQLTFDALREVPPPPGVNPVTGEITDDAISVG